MYNQKYMEIRNVFIETYGCSANLNNTEIIKGLIKQAGLELVNNEEIADIIIINSCIVKSPTENKIKARLINLEKLNKPIILTGCMPDVRKPEGKNLYLLSNHQIKNISKLIKKIIDSNYNEKEFLITKPEIKLNLAKSNEIKKIGITQILEGCLGECSYCITRFAKGKLFSYPEEEIIKNIETDLKQGCKEIWITSQDNASYNLDNKKHDLPKLLNKILALNYNFRLRLGMMNPNNILPILDELIEIYKNEKMYQYLHIPVQSASNKILKDMNRYYKVEDFLKIIKKFKKEIPSITIATDIIVAYPEESEKDFQETFSLIEEIQPEQLNVSKFWPIKGTKAALLPQISAEVSKDRAEELMNLFNRIIKEKNEKLIDSVQSCLVYDSFNNNYLARTKSYKLVLVKSIKNILGKLVKVRIVKQERNHLVGELE
jgi:MiaB-like tRNA modifying enzyme